MNIEKHRAFLDSLDGEKGLPEEMHGISFRLTIEDLRCQNGIYDADDLHEYMVERCRRVESRQIPDLKEKVKELMRDAMDIASKQVPAGQYYYEQHHKVLKQWRALCKPEVKP